MWRWSVAAVLLTVAVSGLAIATTSALASCAPPPSVAELGQRADAVVYARVQGFEGPPGGPPGRFALVRVERVLKGSAYADVGVAIGPGADAGPGAPVATSVDYQMERGSDHTLYLKRTAPGGYSTDACSGSHPGPPSAEEERIFGTGKPPDRVPGGIPSADGSDRVVAAIGALIALAAGVASILYAARSTGRVTPT